MQVRPDQWRRGRGQDCEPRHDLPRQAGKVEHEDARRADHERGSEVRLPLDQPHRQCDEHGRDDEVGEPHASFVLLEIPGEHQRQRDLHQLRGLEATDAEIEPAARAVDHRSAERDCDQQQHRHGIERQRSAGELLRSNVGHDPHQHQREAERERLAGDARDALVGGREERHQPHADDRQGGGHQEAVDATREDLPESTEEGEEIFHQSDSSSPGRGASAGADVSLPGARPSR